MPKRERGSQPQQIRRRPDCTTDCTRVSWLRLLTLLPRTAVVDLCGYRCCLRGRCRVSAVHEAKTIGLSSQRTLRKPAGAIRTLVLDAVVPVVPSNLWGTAKQELDVNSLGWLQFEKLVAAVYEPRGYLVQPSGGANPAGGREKREAQWMCSCRTRRVSAFLDRGEKINAPLTSTFPTEMRWRRGWLWRFPVFWQSLRLFPDRAWRQFL